MKINDKQHLPLIVIMILNSLLIITVNYVVTKQIVTDVQEKINQNEYDRIGGKDNYTILKELQKAEAVSYVDKLKKEDPALIYKMRQNAIIKESPDKKLLNWEGLNELKKDSHVKGSSGATISILEFSDMQCSYCKDLHNGNAIQDILEDNKDINYIFKNFPLPNHEYSGTGAKYAKCVEKMADGKKYLDFIGKIYEEGSTSSGDLNEKSLDRAVLDMQLDLSRLKECSISQEIEASIKKEFDQGLGLGIDSTPTLILVDNETGEYSKLVGNVSQNEIKDAILGFYE